MPPLRHCEIESQPPGRTWRSCRHSAKHSNHPTESLGASLAFSAEDASRAGHVSGIEAIALANVVEAECRQRSLLLSRETSPVVGRPPTKAKSICLGNAKGDQADDASWHSVLSEDDSTWPHGHTSAWKFDESVARPRCHHDDREQHRACRGCHDGVTIPVEREKRPVPQVCRIRRSAPHQRGPDSRAGARQDLPNV